MCLFIKPHNTKNDGFKQVLVYDFSGKKWQVKELDLANNQLSTHSYIRAFEFEDTSLSLVHHSREFIKNLKSTEYQTGSQNGNIQGARIVSTQKITEGKYEAEHQITLLPGFEATAQDQFSAEIKPQSPQYQWQYALTDHLGNLRVLFADKNGDGLIRQDTNSVLNEVLSIRNYSPFGLELGGSHKNLDLQNQYRFGGKEVDAFSSYLDFGGRWYDSNRSGWNSVDPKASKMPAWSPYSFCFNNPLIYVDPNGQEPILPYVGTAAMFRALLNNSPRGVGNYSGGQAASYLRSLGNTEWNWKQFRPLPTETGYFNKKESRYIYTEKGGWIDMAHFMFYAGKAYDYKLQKMEAQKVKESIGFPLMQSEAQLAIIKTAGMSPVSEALQDGYAQEKSDKYAAKYSAYSYEDLPSDKFGADFGANYFNPKSKLTFGEQLQNYLNGLGATDPKNAPNYNSLPKTELTDKPTRTNNTTKPVYTKENP